MSTFNTSTADFERAMARELHRFTDKTKRRQPRKAPRKRPSATRQPDLVVKIVVRKKRLGMDSVYTYKASTLFELQATCEAKQAARADGWPIFGHLQSIEKSEAGA